MAKRPSSAKPHPPAISTTLSAGRRELYRFWPTSRFWYNHSLRGQSPAVEFFSTGSAREGSLETVNRLRMLQSRIESGGHTVFQFRPTKETSSLPRRALLMGGFAGAVSRAFPGVANAATAIALPAAGGDSLSCTRVSRSAPRDPGGLPRLTGDPAVRVIVLTGAGRAPSVPVAKEP